MSMRHLDFNTSSTLNVSHASVDSPCISCRTFLTKSHDDMLAMSCYHDKNVSISSSYYDNNVEENQQSMEQDVVLNGASRDPTSSSIVSHFCLMAKASKVSPTLKSDISHDGDDVDNVNDEEDDNIASLKIKGEMIFKSLHKNKITCSNFLQIMSIGLEGIKYLEELESHLEENEVTIERMEGHERDYTNEIGDLSQAHEEEKTTRESLEETFALELSKVKESLDRALEVLMSSKLKMISLKLRMLKSLRTLSTSEMAQGSLRVSSSNSPSLMPILKLLM